MPLGDGWGRLLAKRSPFIVGMARASVLTSEHLIPEMRMTSNALSHTPFATSTEPPSSDPYRYQTASKGHFGRPATLSGLRVERPYIHKVHIVLVHHTRVPHVVNERLC
jgi:hypothetical protein